jgi:hypothetical protein
MPVASMLCRMMGQHDIGKRGWRGKLDLLAPQFDQRQDWLLMSNQDLIFASNVDLFVFLAAHITMAIEVRKINRDWGVL